MLWAVVDMTVGKVYGSSGGSSVAGVIAKKRDIGMEVQRRTENVT